MLKNLKRSLILRASYCLLFLLHKSYRYVIINEDHLNESKSLSRYGGFAIASWHNNCLAGILSHAGHKICLMVSRSLDGEFVAFLSGRLGMNSVRGSSSKGGREALVHLTDKVREGWAAAITVDGPRGPYKKVKSGVIALASQTNTAIQPLCAVGEHQWVFSKSWDQFRVPKPFSRVAVVYGKPILVDEYLGENHKQEVQSAVYDALEGLEEEARLFFNRSS